MGLEQNRCPKCGSTNLQALIATDVKTHGKDYSASKGCCGALLLGPFGLLCGSCGKGKQTTTTNTTVFVCQFCGYQFRKG